MTVGEWLSAEARAARENNDQDRLHMMGCYSRAFQLRETDPDGAFAAFTEGRDLALRLHEPWWALYYEKYRIDALVHFKRDFRQVIDMAVKCVLDLNRPGNAAYPGRLAVWDSLLAAYLGVDAEGYATEIQQAIDTLEQEVPKEPVGERYLLLARRQVFGLELNRYQEVYQHCMAELKLAAEDTNQDRGAHYAVFVFCELCQVGAAIRNWPQVGKWAKAGENLAEIVGHQCERAEATAWQAVAALHGGDRAEAARLVQSAATTVSGLGMPPNRGYFEALFCYHLSRGDLEGALSVREEERRAVEGRGRVLYESRLHLDRCRLLHRLGRLRSEDLDDARAASSRLRKPQPYLDRINELSGGRAGA
jgi:hypothetical protein